MGTADTSFWSDEPMGRGFSPWAPKANVTDPQFTMRGTRYPHYLVSETTRTRGHGSVCSSL